MKSIPSPITPTVRPLSRLRRRIVFLSLVLFFFCSVPIFVFYAIGYRYNFFDPQQASIVATGGLYLSVGVTDGDVFLNEEPVRDLRVFRNAMYIQNLNPGMHRLHVQTPGLHTWVKELPVYPFIVTEAEAFALPLVPQVRPITEFKTSTGTAVFMGTSSVATLFSGVSSTVVMIATTSKATSTLIHNSEYEYIVGLFATSTTASTTLLGRVTSEASEAFTFASKTPATSTTTLATTTIIQDNLKLYKFGEDVYIDYIGSSQNIPYYFCVPEATLASTSELYGVQVMQGVALVLAATSSEVVSESANRNRVCRSSIRIDRQWQEVMSFDFYPSATDLVVIHRSDGVFVTEIDDRSWQNTQALYPYPVDELVIDAGRMYVKRGNLILELLTVLPIN